MVADFLYAVFSVSHSVKSKFGNMVSNNVSRGVQGRFP